MKFKSAIVLWILALSLPQTLWCQTLSSPALEVNLGPIAIDSYDGVALNAAIGNYSVKHGPIPCALTYRACVQSVLSGYSAQGVTGVAIQLGLTGGGTSTPFQDSPTQQPATSAVKKKGEVSSAWLNQLALFFNDVRSANIPNVSIRLDMIGGLAGNGGPNNMVIEYCLNSSQPAGQQLDVCSGGASTAYVYPWLPWALTPGGTAPVDGTDVVGYQQANSLGGSYNAAIRAGSWGWGSGSAFVVLFTKVMAQAQGAGVNVEEVALLDEADLVREPVLARLIYDNTTDSYVLGFLNTIARGYGFGRTPGLGPVTFSTAAGAPSYVNREVTATYPDADSANALQQCDSQVYGASAVLLPASEFLMAGIGGLFGVVEQLNPNPVWGLVCDDGNTSNLISIPSLAGGQGAPLPGVIDVHNYPCDALNGNPPDPNGTGCNPDSNMPDSTKCVNCGLRAASKMIYSDIHDLLASWAMDSGLYTVMIGETTPNDNLQCLTCSYDPASKAGAAEYPTWPLPTQLEVSNNWYPVYLSGCSQIVSAHCSLWTGGNTPQGAEQGALGFADSTLYKIDITNPTPPNGVTPVVLRPFEPMSDNYVNVPAAIGSGTDSGRAPWGATLPNHPPGVGGPYGVGSCVFGVSGGGTVPASGGSLTFYVTTSAISGTSMAACPWAAGPAAPATAGGISSLPLAWPHPISGSADVTVTGVSVNGQQCGTNCWYTSGGAQGVPVQITIAANTNTYPRSSTMVIAGNDITVTQNGTNGPTSYISATFYDWNGYLLPSGSMDFFVLDEPAFYYNLANPAPIPVSPGQHTIELAGGGLANYGKAACSLQGGAKAWGVPATVSGGQSLSCYFLPTNVDLVNLPPGSPTSFDASSNITAGGDLEIQNGAGVKFQAGTKIVLTPGFHAGGTGTGTGTTFHAFIGNSWL